MSTIFRSIGFLIIIIGILSGILIGVSMTIPDPKFGISSITQPDPLSWVYGGAVIASSFIFGMLLIGFGRIIESLLSIEKKIVGDKNDSEGSEILNQEAAQQQQQT